MHVVFKAEASNLPIHRRRVQTLRSENTTLTLSSLKLDASGRSRSIDAVKGLSRDVHLGP